MIPRAAAGRGRAGLAMMLALLAALWLALASGALAQDTAGSGDPAWEALATQAETTLARDGASDAALSDLRRRVVAARTGFAAAQGANATRIATLESQIAALGPAADGEDPGVTARRGELTAQLAVLRAPVLRAEESYRRADGLIEEIDATLRARQTAQLTRVGPSPLRPETWPDAWEALQGSLLALRREVLGEWQTPAARQGFMDRLPQVAIYLVLALVLVGPGARWGETGVAMLRLRFGSGTGVWQFLRSLMRLVIPLAGLFALTAALEATGLIGVRGALILQMLPWWGVTILAAHWLAAQVFDADGLRGMAPLSGFARAESIWLTTGLAALMVLADALDRLAAYDRYDEVTVAVLRFPILALGGLALLMLARRLSAMRSPQDALRGGLVRLAGRGAVLVGLAAPILAAAGLGTAAQAILFPAALTLALGAGVLVAQELVHGLYRLVTGRPSGDSLIPLFAGFFVFLAALPVLALIWGARTTDLLDIWTRFTEGVSFGGMQLSPASVALFAGVFALGYAITRTLQATLTNSVLPRTALDAGAQTALASAAGYLGIFLSAVVGFAAAGLDLSNLALVAGALSVGIGFGLQNIVSNFVSGMILLAERPISQGDWIEVGGTHGIVKEISVRSTRIETFDKFDLIVPNADLVSGKVTNYTRGNVIGRVIVPISVSYDSDPREVERILLSIARAHDMVLMNPAPAVDFLGFGDSALDFRIRAVLRDVNYVLSVRNDMNYQILERFREAGIEIPFPQRDLHLRSGALPTQESS